MMKKIFLYSLLFLAFAGCEKDETTPQNGTPQTQNDPFKKVLLSKTWKITRYELQDHMNTSFPLRNFVTDSIFTRNSQVSPDPCNWSGTKTSPLGIWNSYTLVFTGDAMNGAFSHILRTIDWEKTDQPNCILAYKVSDTTTPVSSAWTYNSTTQTLTVNFGEPYKILDGESEYFEIAYSVTSYNDTQIVLEGTRNYEGELFLTSKITLE